MVGIIILAKNTSGFRTEKKNIPYIQIKININPILTPRQGQKPYKSMKMKCWQGIYIINIVGINFQGVIFIE